MSNQQLPSHGTMSQEQLFDNVAAKQGKTTIVQKSLNGGYLLWVTKDEKDPMTALMSIALLIMVQNGYSPEHSSGITIRRVTEVVAPGCEVFWQVTDADGVVIQKGYAKDEAEAASKIAEYVKPNIQLPSNTALSEDDARSMFVRCGPAGTEAVEWDTLDEDVKGYWRQRARNRV